MRADIQSIHSDIDKARPLAERDDTSPSKPTALTSVCHWDALQLVRRESAFNVYTACNKQSGESAELIIITTDQSAFIKEIETQKRRAELLRDEATRKAIEFQSHQAPFHLVLEAPAPRSIESFLSEASEANSLQIILQIVNFFAASQRLGFALRAFDESCIRASAAGQLQIDLFACSVLLNSTRDNSTADPWQCFTRFIHKHLSRIATESPSDGDRLSARQRASLKQLLKDAEAEDSADALDWQSLFQSIGFVDQVPERSTQEIWHSLDHTSELLNSAPQSPPFSASHDELDATQETGIVESLPAITEATPAENFQHKIAADLSAARQVHEGDTIGRYRLGSLLGQGGMGAVYSATDLVNDQIVAVKILRTTGKDIAQSVRRFRKEARLLAEVQNDYVTRLYEVGHDRGVHFLAMELIDGISLKEWLQSAGPLNEADSLRVMSDIARALVEAHERGIVHRDIKPENILLAKNNRFDSSRPSLRDYQIKLSDFGIARQIQQSGSLEVTHAGTLLGTPLYMAPEQFKGDQAIDATVDIYALGVTWFQLLTGQLPFSSNDPMKLAAMHCFDTPPSLQKLKPELTDAVCNLVQRMLSKSRGDRFADAGQLLRAIERVLRGEPAAMESHPRIPECLDVPLWERTFTWDLKSNPTQLWPFVSNTERLNRALGLPSVKYRTVPNPQGGVRKFGEFKLGAVHVSWEEHPFEWIEGKRMGILREFTSGPFAWFLSTVDLQPFEGGGTKLIHQVRIQPRNRFGRYLAAIEAGWKGGRQLDRVYRRMDRSIQGQLQSTEGTDPFEPPPRIKRAQQKRIHALSDRAIELGVDPDVMQRLAEHLEFAAPQTLAQMRPLLLADQWQLPRDRVVDACLTAAHVGLLNLRWDVLCPTCRAPAATRDLLKEIEQHTHCEACAVDFRSNIAEAIELVFRAHPQVRQVDDATYCIGGPEHSPHVVMQARLAADERMELEVSLPVGDYLVRGPQLARQQTFKVRPSGAPSRADWRLSHFGNSQHVPSLKAGSQSIALTNDLPHLQLVRIERWIARDHVVTAAAAAALPRFRQYFPEQRFAAGVAVASEELTLLAIGVTQVDEIYRCFGDSDAYARIQKHLDRASTCITAAGGQVVKTMGESLLAVFSDCSQAVRAAITINADPEAIESLQGFAFGIGVHRGKTLVSTQNDRIDYFGGAARAVQSLPAVAQRGVLLTEQVFTDPGVREEHNVLLSKSTIQTLDLPGAPGQFVQRLSTVAEART